MAFNPITTGEQTLSSAGAFTGSLDTSTYTGDMWSAKLKVTGLNAGATAIIALQDTANVTAFSDAVTVATVHVVGPATAENPRELAFRRSDIPATRIGVANSKLRYNLVSVSAGSVKVQGWLEP